MRGRKLEGKRASGRSRWRLAGDLGGCTQLRSDFHLDQVAFCHKLKLRVLWRAADGCIARNV